MWFWDGRAWQYSIPQRRERPGMLWFLSAPDWAGSFFLMGLIAALPIVGVMNLLGWYLAVRDNLRAGYWVLPKAGLGYLDRGASVFAVQLIYGLYAWPIYIVLGLVILFILLVGAPVAAVVLLILGLVLAFLVVELILGFVAAAMISVTDREGIGAGLDPFRVWRVAQANSRTSWRVFGAYLLGTLGIYAMAWIGFLVPFGVLLINLLLPAAFLMAAPAQAEFQEWALDAEAVSGRPGSR